MTAETPAPPSDWLVMREVKAIAHLGDKLIYKEIKAGRLRAARVGGRRGPLRVHRTWVDAWLTKASEMVEVR